MKLSRTFHKVRTILDRRLGKVFARLGQGIYSGPFPPHVSLQPELREWKREREIHRDRETRRQTQRGIITRHAQ